MAVDFKDFERRMNKALDHLDEEFGAVRAGRANPKVLPSVNHTLREGEGVAEKRAYP